LFVALGLAAYLFRREIIGFASAIVEFFQSKTSALPNNQEVMTAMAIPVGSPTSRSDEQQPHFLDLVDVSRLCA
jgi:hypothetical protein